MGPWGPKSWCIWALCRSEEEEGLACLQGWEETLVPGKVPCGGHCAADGHVLMTMPVGPLCLSPDDLGWRIQEASIALRDELAMKGFWGFTVRTTALWLPREWERSSLENLDLLQGSHHPSAHFLQAKSPPRP